MQNKLANVIRLILGINSMDGKKLVAIKGSEISGHGTFAEEKIAKGSYITTLTGTPFKKEHVIANDDPLEIDEHTYLNLDYASKTINHSCNPNAGIRNKSDLYAIKDINIGDEITYDYSTTIGIDDTISCMICRCKTELCRHQIRNVLSIPKSLLLHYLELDALPLFIRRQLGI